MPTFIVVHGSVSGKQVGEELVLGQLEADHINSSGKMLRREDEPEVPRKRADTGVRSGERVGSKVKAKLQGDVVSSTADEVDEGPTDEPEAKKHSKKKGN